MPSKFTEHLDPSYRTTSPESDVRLEDIIGAADLSTRGRAASSGSSNGGSSGERTPTLDAKMEKRRSWMWGGGRR